MSRLSVSIIGHNEGESLDRCLNSVKDADEIIYVDCESIDNSIEIAKKYTDKIYSRENDLNLNVNKSYGFIKAANEWLLYIDPDEVVSDSLWEEIKRAANSKYDGFYIPRKNYYFGRWLKRGAKYPDYQLRLFRKDKGKFQCLHIHEKIKIDGEIGYLKSPIIHYPYETVSQLIKKFDFYTSIEANYLRDNSTNVNFFNTYKNMIHLPFFRFIKRYVFKFGFLDGMPGLFACIFDALSYPVKYFKLWQLYESEK